MLVSIILILLFPAFGDAADAFAETGLTSAKYLEMAEAPFLDDDQQNPQVRKVRFNGNETYPNMILREIVGTKAPRIFRRMQFWKKGGFDVSETELRRDVIRLQRFYNRRGFYEARISFEVTQGRKDNHRIVTFYIREGDPNIVRDLHIHFDAETEIVETIESDRSYQRTVNRNPLRQGRRYEFIRHTDIESMFQNTLQDMGYAFATAKVEATVDTAAFKTDVHIHLKPGVVGFLDNILVEGNSTVSEDMVKYHSGLRKGQQFSNRRLRSAQQMLFRHPLFRFVTVNVPEQEEVDEVDVRLRVREAPLRTIQMQGGVGTEEIVRGQLSWTHRNPFGNAHRFSVTARASFIEQRANMEYLVPGFLNPRSNLSFSPYVLREDERSYLLKSGGIFNNLTYYHSQYLIGNIGYEFSRNTVSQKDGAKVTTDSTRVFNVSSLKLSALYNQSTGTVGKGWAVRPYAEVSGFLNTGTIVYQKLSLDVRRFIDVTPTTQLALRTDAGVLFSSDPFDTPANIRFYAGGTNSVRGWQRSQLGPKRAVLNDDGSFRTYIPTGGQAMAMFNSELRQDLPLFLEGFQLAAFLDGGQVFLNYSDMNFNDFQFGVGGGIRYMSPIGPIRLDFGYKLNPDDSDMNRFDGQRHGGVSRWVMHFSIGQAF